jgi:hypothetical protein
VKEKEGNTLTDLGKQNKSIKRVLRAEVGLQQHGDRTFNCGALLSDVGTSDPQECNWPFCACDPHAEKVIAAILESGFSIVKDEDLLKIRNQL